MINLDHTYMCDNGESVSINGIRRRCNIRPSIHEELVSIQENTSKPLVTQHDNSSAYSYTSLLRAYIDRYLSEISCNCDQLIFVTPTLYNKTSLINALEHLQGKMNIKTIKPSLAAATGIRNVVNEKSIMIIPDEYETSISVFDNSIVYNEIIIPKGSRWIKETIKKYIPIDISLQDAWNIYTRIQMLDKINLSDFIFQIENEYIITRDEIFDLLKDYYCEIYSNMPTGIRCICPFRWIARDYWMKENYSFVTLYNVDETICLGAWKYFDNEERVQYIGKEHKYIDHKSYLMRDYMQLRTAIKMADAMSIFANIVDKYMIDTGKNINIPYKVKNVRKIFILINSNTQWIENNEKDYEELCRAAKILM